LITDLSKVKELQVIPRHSSFQFKDTRITLPDVARQLNVRYLVQGSVRQKQEEIRINVQLVDAQSNQEVWATRFDDKVDNIFSLQDQIIAEILKNLGMATPQKQAPLPGTALPTSKLTTISCVPNIDASIDAAPKAARALLSFTASRSSSIPSSSPPTRVSRARH
jgi:hypothetical protein